MSRGWGETTDCRTSRKRLEWWLVSNDDVSCALGKSMVIGNFVYCWRDAVFVPLIVIFLLHCFKKEHQYIAPDWNGLRLHANSSTSSRRYSKWWIWHLTLLSTVVACVHWLFYVYSPHCRLDIHLIKVLWAPLLWRACCQMLKNAKTFMLYLSLNFSYFKLWTENTARNWLFPCLSRIVLFKSNLLAKTPVAYWYLCYQDLWF